MSCSQTEALHFTQTRLSRRLREDFKATCWHNVFSCQQPACTLHYFSHFLIFNFSYLEFKVPTIAIVPECKKQGSFQPESDGEVMIRIWWWELQRSFLKKLTKAFSSWVSFLPFLPHPFCFLWPHILWIRWVSNEVIICGLEWVKLYAAHAEIVTLIYPSHFAVLLGWSALG